MDREIKKKNEKHQYMVFGFPVIYIVNILFFINHFYTMQPHQAAAK